MNCNLPLPWSPVDSAAPAGQLAITLAGFAVAVLAILVTTRGTHDPTRISALNLFTAVFIAFGVDGYLFNRVVGGNFDRACGLIWSQEMLAAGVLGIGAIALVAGIVWVLAVYVGPGAGSADSAEDEHYQGRLATLARLLRVALYVTAMVTIAMQTVTADAYLKAWFGADLPAWTWLVRLYWLGILIAVTFLEWRYRHRRPNDRVRAFEIGVYGAVIYTGVAGVVVA
ncbi:MAG: hypothetical protein ACRDOO_24190, partial [Actinomadura sp.]